MPAARDLSTLPVAERERIIAQRAYRRAWQRKDREANPEKIKAVRDRRNAKLRNLDKNSLEWQQILATNRRFREADPERQKRYRQKEEQNLSTKLRRRLRSRLRCALHGNYKTGSAVTDLGCSVEELKIWLERQFTLNMSWSNYGTEWHIDHKKALASFDLTDPHQLKAACHFTNLQPLTVLDNLKKGAS